MSRPSGQCRLTPREQSPNVSINDKSGCDPVASAERALTPFAPLLTDAGDLLTLQRSGLFAAKWFLERNPDLGAAGVDPLAHYYRYGWREGRLPNPYFDPAPIRISTPPGI
jgi:hypothetical protein